MVAVFGMLETTTAGKQLSAVGRELLALGLYKSRAFDERKAATDYARRLLDKMAEQHPRVACRWKNCTLHLAFHFAPHVVDQDHSSEHLSLRYFYKIELFVGYYLNLVLLQLHLHLAIGPSTSR